MPPFNGRRTVAVRCAQCDGTACLWDAGVHGWEPCPHCERGLDHQDPCPELFPRLAAARSPQDLCALLGNLECLADVEATAAAALGRRDESNVALTVAQVLNDVRCALMHATGQRAQYRLERRHLLRLHREGV